MSTWESELHVSYNDGWNNWMNKLTKSRSFYGDSSDTSGKLTCQRTWKVVGAIDSASARNWQIENLLKMEVTEAPLWGLKWFASVELSRSTSSWRVEMAQSCMISGWWISKPARREGPWMPIIWETWEEMTESLVSRKALTKLNKVRYPPACKSCMACLSFVLDASCRWWASSALSVSKQTTWNAQLPWKGFTSGKDRDHEENQHLC